MNNILRRFSIIASAAAITTALVGSAAAQASGGAELHGLNEIVSSGCASGGNGLGALATALGLCAVLGFARRRAYTRRA